jgi:tetratricopeptide (TPR) repeat protein
MDGMDRMDGMDASCDACDSGPWALTLPAASLPWASSPRLSAAGASLRLTDPSLCTVMSVPTAPERVAGFFRTGRVWWYDAPSKTRTMTRQRLRVVGRRPGGDERSVETGPPGNPGTDGFSLRFSGGRGVLTLAGEQVFSAATVELLEIAIPRLSFPFDVSTGIRGLRDRRHTLSRLVLSLRLDALEGILRERLPAGSWVHAPRLALEQDCLSVLVDFGPEGDRVPFSFRLLPAVGERAPSLLIDEPRACGPLPAPLLSVAISCVRDLTGARPGGLDFSFPDPVKKALLELLPRRGWRLPDHTGVMLARLEFHGDRAVLDYRHPELIDDVAEPANPGAGLPRLRRLEEIRIVRAGDRLLAEGDTAGAREIYSRLYDQDPDNPFLACRLAMIDVVDPGARDTARALAEDHAARAPERRDLTAVLAHGAALARDLPSEIEMLERLFESGLAAERLAAASRLGRVLEERDPAAAMGWYRRALTARREDSAALLGLLRTGAAAGEADQVRQLIPRWIAAHHTPRARSRAHLVAGEILLATMGDAPAALRHFERASLADPEDLDAAWGLAQALAAAGEAERAINQYERLGRLFRERGDLTATGRAIEAIGDVWQARDEPRLAIPRFREVIDSGGGSPALYRKLARALSDLGRAAEAAVEYETSLRAARPDDERFPWAETVVDLARLYLEQLDDPAAADRWIREAIGHPGQGTAARELLHKVLEQSGRWRELTRELEREVVAEPTPDSVLALARARIRSGDFQAAIGTLETARERHPGRVDLLDAMIEASRMAGEKSRLRGLLIDRLQTEAEAGPRAVMAAEIGALELRSFENPTAALGWFHRAVDDDADLLEARAGLADVLRRLGRVEELEPALDCLAASLLRRGRAPEAARSIAERAGLLASAGHANRAATLLREALPDLPEEDRGRTMLEMARLFGEADNPVAARDMFHAARQEPNPAGEYPAALGEAEASLKTGDYQRAHEAASVAGSGPPVLRARAAALSAEALLSLGRAEDAAATLERVAENLDEGAETRSLLMLAARIRRNELGDLERARWILERIVDADPDHPGAREALIEILEAAGDRVELAEGLVQLAAGGDDPVADLQRAADFFSAEGLHDRAATALRRAWSLRPAPETARMLAAALRRSGEGDELLALLGETADGDQDLGRMLEVELAGAGRFDDLASRLGNREPYDGEDPVDLLVRLADVHEHGLDDAERAVEALARARALALELGRDTGPLDGRLTGLYLDLADQATSDGQSARVREAVQRALELAPRNLGVLERATRLAAEDERWADVVHLADGIPEQSRGAFVERLLARALERLGRRPEAADAWRRIVMREPDDPTNLDSLARLLADLGSRADLAAVLGRRAELTADPALRADLLARRASARAEATGNPAEGLTDLVTAARIHPAARNIVNAATDAAAAAGDWSVAEEMLTLALERTRDAERARLLRRRAAIRRARLGNDDGAAADLLEAHRAEALLPPELEVLAELLEAQGRLDEAARIAAEVARADGQDPERLAWAARMAAKAGRIDGARDLLRQAVRLDPAPAHLVALIRLLDPAADAAELGCLLEPLEGREDLLDIPDHLDVLQARVEFDLARGRESDALDGLNAIMKLAPAASEPWEKMTRVLERRGEWVKLAERMRQRLELALPPGEIARTSTALGRLLEENLGDENGAEAAYLQALRATPDDPAATLALARLAFGRQRWSELDRLLARFPEEEAEETETRLWRAIAAGHCGRRDEALERYRELLARDPSSARAVEGLLGLLPDPADDAEVLAVGERLLAVAGVAGVKPAILRRFGLAQMRAGATERAVEILSEADRLAGGDPQSLELLAQVYERGGDYRAQAEALTRLAHLFSGGPSAAHLAVAGRLYLERLADPHQARRLFQIAAGVDPDNPEVLLGLADSGWPLGDSSEVARNLERLTVIAPWYHLDPQRMYRMAAALDETGAWPQADVLELLLRAIQGLEGEERRSAEALAAALAEGRNRR